MGSLEVINPSSLDQNCSEASLVMCAWERDRVTHLSHLRGRDVSKRGNAIGPESNQSVSTEELQSGAAGLEFQS